MYTYIYIIYIKLYVCVCYLLCSRHQCWWNSTLSLGTNHPANPKWTFSSAFPAPSPHTHPRICHWCVLSPTESSHPGIKLLFSLLFSWKFVSGTFTFSICKGEVECEKKDHSWQKRRDFHCTHVGLLLEVNSLSSSPPLSSRPLISSPQLLQNYLEFPSVLLIYFALMVSVPSTRPAHIFVTI